jgi:mannan endo-1,4-beta-mannosidase
VKIPSWFLLVPVAVLSLLSAPVPAPAADLNVLVLADRSLGSISPWIYGTNVCDTEGTGATIKRLGGNRLTGYNWETNASNAGNDWKHFSDDWLCTGGLRFPACPEPGGLVTQFVDRNKAEGLESIVTLQMAGFVSADKDGEVTEEQAAPSRRWKEVLFRKKGALSETPNPKDNAVHMDEFVYFLGRRFGSADKGGVRFYCLDNEPALWPSTHPRIHPKKTGYYEMVNKTEACAANVLRVDPGAILIGPVLYGWQAFLTLQEAPEFKEVNAQFGSFVGFYLDQMKALEARHKKRLLHVLDLHWYPEARGGGKRITEGDTSDESIEARVQAPRSLWDPSYVEQSWITQHSTAGKPIRLIPWIRENIEKYYPGTRMGFTEYDYGAGNHVSGGIAQADVLGILGREGAFVANYWGEMKAYNKAAFRIFRDYDGKGARFGDAALSAAADDAAKLSVYASRSDQNPGKLWVLVIHKQLKEKARVSVAVKEGGPYTRYAAYGFDGDSADIRPLKGGVVREGGFIAVLAPLSATLFVLE